MSNVQLFSCSLKILKWILIRTIRCYFFIALAAIGMRMYIPQRVDCRHIYPLKMEI